eukprot:Gb_22377 [translate_table: standard]
MCTSSVVLDRVEDKNPTRKPESSDKVIEDIALLAEAENCQPKARPSGASPNLMCVSKILSNITHEPVKAANPRYSKGIPQASTKESHQGTSQSLLGRLLHQQDKLKETPWFFIKPHLKIDETTTNHSSKRDDEPPRYTVEEETSTENTEESLDTFDYHLNLGLNATMSPNGGNQNNFYGNFGNNHSFQIRIPNFEGQACTKFNTNIFQNTNSMGGAYAFSQGPTYPNNCWNNNLGSYGNGPVPSMNPTNQFSTVDTEYGFVKKEDDAASSRDSTKSIASSHSESTYHCEKANDPHKPTMEDETNINFDVDSKEFITNYFHEADELNDHSYFHLERLPDINEEEMGYYEEDSEEEDADDEEEIEPEVIQQDPDENTFQLDEMEGATHLIRCEEKWEQEKLQWHSKWRKLFLCTLRDYPLTWFLLHQQEWRN